MFLRDLDKYIDQEIEIQGLVDNIRNLQWVQFLIVRDNTSKLQVTIEKSEEQNKELVEIVNNLTERQLEFLKKQPVRRIELQTIYDLVQATPHNATLKVLDYKGNLVDEKVHSDTIYVSKETFIFVMNLKRDLENDT